VIAEALLYYYMTIHGDDFYNNWLEYGPFPTLAACLKDRRDNWEYPGNDYRSQRAWSECYTKPVTK
jgi:hypothetical protein